MKLILVVLLAVFLTTADAAETLEVEYASFYSHVKKLDDPETNALRFAFGFWHIVHKRLCQVTAAKIVTQKQQLPLVIESSGRFTVPLDKILKMAKATVNIDLVDQANQCDMSVQLETLPKYLKTQYNNDELLFLFSQYQSFFKDMGGFLSFMMPSVDGLNIMIEDEAELTDELKTMLKTDGALLLTQEWISQGHALSLPQNPLRITANIDK